MDIVLAFEAAAWVLLACLVWGFACYLAYDLHKAEKRQKERERQRRKQAELHAETGRVRIHEQYLRDVRHEMHRMRHRQGR